MPKQAKIIVIVGSNASGKSDYAVKLAKKIGGEVVSADSRQVYKGLNIGSGKITKKEAKGIPHHCLSIANPKKVFTADDFKICARKAIADILSRGKIPIIAGGTGFYIDAALGRIKLGGIPPKPLLRKKLERKSSAQLLAILKKLNPKRVKTIEQKNPRRLIRAIEIAEAQKSGTKMIEEHALVPPAQTVWIGIRRSPEELKKRIKKRLFRRLPGIIREVKYLHFKKGLSWKRLFDLGLEYRFASLYLRGKLTREEFTKQLETAIWHYAKRQMTWFKKNKEIRWIS